MSKPNILVTLPQGTIFDSFFNKKRMQRLETLGNVEWNSTPHQITPEEMMTKIPGKDIVITGWGSPIFTPDILKCADRLQLIAHCGGSVRPYVTDEVYQKGIRVCCGNPVFAQSVAEGVIAYALASLRRIPHYSTALGEGHWDEDFQNRGLLGRSVGIVGYGMISRYLVDMLKVFDTPIKVYSSHITQKELDDKGMTKASLEEIFKTCDIVSIHSALTPANHHLITEELMDSMKDGALLINTARGAVIDEEAMVRVLKRKNITAALDVFETEPLPSDSPLIGLDNVLLMPHMAGPTLDRRLAVTEFLMDDIENFISQRPLKGEISAGRATKMTTE